MGVEKVLLEYKGHTICESESTLDVYVYGPYFHSSGTYLPSVAKAKQAIDIAIKMRDRQVGG
jgi:hypothetical protein